MNFVEMKDLNSLCKTASIKKEGSFTEKVSMRGDWVTMQTREVEDARSLRGSTYSSYNASLDIA